MQIFVSYEGQRAPMHIGDATTVEDLKCMLRDTIHVESELHVEAEDGMTREKKRLVLTYNGADLDDKWVLSDIGVFPGSTVRACIKEEFMPNLFIYCAYSEEVVPITEKISIRHSGVAELRGIVSRKTGLPIGAFRLVNQHGQEMFDCHGLDHYGIQVAQEIRMDTWDGWNDFLNLAVMGFTSHAIGKLSSDEYVARFQMRVALYIAAHYGHVDLAASLLKQGIRPYDSIGYHPSRQWCSSQSGQAHTDSFKTPCHEAAEFGSVDVMRVFVQSSVSSIFIEDANGLMPLNLALRNRRRPVAIYLLAKQWSKIEYGNSGITIPLKLYSKMKLWAERGRERAFVLYGQEKSTLKRKGYINRGVLVGQGVTVDGYLDSPLSSRIAPKDPLKKDEIKSLKRPSFLVRRDRRAQKAIQDVATAQKSGKRNRTHHRSSTRDRGLRERKVSRTRELSARSHDSESVEEPARTFLPPISQMQKHRPLSSSHHELSHGRIEDEFSRPGTHASSRAAYLETGYADINDQTKGKEEHLDKYLSNMELNKIPRKSISQPNPSKPFTPISQPRKKRRQKSPDDVSPGQATEVPEPNAEKPASRGTVKRKERSIRSALRLAKAKTEDVFVPLPEVSLESNDRPFYYCREGEEDPRISTLNLVERYRGMKSRDNAVKCMAAANTFKEKPWLHQVRLAMTLAEFGVKRLLRNSGAAIKTHSRSTTI